MAKDIKVLVLDDEDFIRDNLTAYLEDEDFQVFSASSGEEALPQVQSQALDVAIVDMRLPQMNGTEFILNAKEINPHLKFLIYTGSTEFTLTRSLKDIGMTNADLLRKPLTDLRLLG